MVRPDGIVLVSSTKEPTMTTFALILNIKCAMHNYWLPANAARDLYIAGQLGMHRSADGVWNYCQL